MRPPLLLCALLALLCLTQCRSKSEPIRLRLATTTSTESSGLLPYLLEPFEQRAHIRVERIAVGTGHALKLGRAGDADLLLVHARAREDAFVAAGDGIERRDIMWNDFIIAGPEADPAGIAGDHDAPAALAKIARAGAVFVSRADDSGTHTRERDLWKAAGGRPAWEGYLEAGQGMGACLTIADQKRAYLLTDRGTFLAYRRRLALVPLVQGDPRLRNPYGAMLVNPAKHPHVKAKAARRLLDYLTSPQGQARIGAFRVQGQQLFHPWADQ